MLLCGPNFFCSTSMGFFFPAVICHRINYSLSSHSLGKSSEQDYILRLRSRLHSLPEENGLLLKYIVSFLVAVCHHQATNKMSPMALAIVFGPNIFR